MRFKSFALLLVLLMGALGLQAQMDMSPSVAVSDQVSLDGGVVIASVYSPTPGFIVIHKADDMGGVGAGVGVRAINQGWSYNVKIMIDTTQATGLLYAMLHEDNTNVGVYEFGTVDGADGPVMVNDAPVTPSFKAEIVRAYDTIRTGDSVTIANVVTEQNGWMVIHANNDGAPGPVLGMTAVTAGMNSNVEVALSGDITDVLFPMLHVDTGEAGVYEFGTVEGADGPVIVNGVVAYLGIQSAQPSMRVRDQIVTDTVVIASAVIAEPGWMVIHADNGSGAPGPVIGTALLQVGGNWNVNVSVDPAGVTPRLFPMLHVDTGEAGVYEFGSVEGADAPMMANGAVLVTGINAASSITYTGTLEGNVLTIPSALSEAQGWLVIHSDNNGAPGPALGVVPVLKGWNESISITLSESNVTRVFPMLHYDTNEIGVYEFGTVEGADAPMMAGGNVVVGALTLP